MNKQPAANEQDAAEAVSKIRRPCKLSPLTQQICVAAPTLWQAGTLGRSFWSGVEAEPSQQRRVVARRCTRCGGLDLFVPEA